MIEDISVVIPTCNRDKYLKNSIETVLNQSILPKEIIVVNNGKTQIEENVYGLCKLIKVINIMPYAGVSQARNIGVVLSKSQYIAFLDDDDLWESDYLKKISVVIDDTAPDMIVSRVDQLLDGKVSSFKDSAKFPQLEDALKFNPGYVGSSMIVKRNSFMEVGGFDVTLISAEDKSLAIEMMSNAYSIKRCSHIQSILRQHTGERLSDYSSMAKGTAVFYEKYSSLMSLEAKVYNYCKLYRSKWNAKKNIFFLVLFLTNGLLYSLFKLIKKYLK